MMISRSHGHKLVGLLEDSICAREMVLISILAAGQDGATERAPIADLYRTLLVAFYSASSPRFNSPSLQRGRSCMGKPSLKREIDRAIKDILRRSHQSLEVDTKVLTASRVAVHSSKALLASKLKRVSAASPAFHNIQIAGVLGSHRRQPHRS